MSAFVNHTSLSYGDYKYPGWAEVIGWLLTLSSVIMIPVVAVISLYKTKGTFKEVKLIFF